MTTSEKTLPNWNGETLGTCSAAIALTDAPNGDVELEVLTTDEDSFAVREERLGEFLTAAADATFFCNGAAELYWRLDAALRRYRAADVAVLRRIVRDGRLVDLDLWAATLEAALPAGQRDSQRLPDNRDTGCQAMLDRVKRLDQIRGNWPMLGTAGGSDSRLGVGFSVQAAIAQQKFAGLRLELQQAERAALIRDVDNQLRRVLEELERVTELRRCYRPTEGDIRMANGRPKSNTHVLRKWLHQTWHRLRAEHDYPVEPPRTTSPAAWRSLVDSHDHLSTWAEFEDLCRLRTALENNTSPVEPAVTVPRLHRLNEYWDRLAGRGVLRPPEGFQFITVKLPDLESRCLARICADSFGESHLLVDAEDAEDLNRHVAGVIDSKTVMPALSEDASSRLSTAFLFATGLLLPDKALVTLLRRKCEVEVTLDEVRRLRNTLLAAYPDLDAYECRSAEVIYANLEISADRQPSDNPRRFAQAHYIGANTTDFTQLFFHQGPYRVLGRVPELQTFLRRGMSGHELAVRTLSCWRQTRTGRLHAPTIFGPETAEFLDLADDVRKSLLFELANQLNGAVGIVADQIVVAIPEGTDFERIELQVRAACDRVGQQILELRLPAVIGYSVAL